MAYSKEVKYFDDFEVGETLASPARTVTETDIVNFAGISGDFNPLHMDEEFAKTTIHGGKIAHGALVFSMSTGLFNSMGFADGTTIANLGLDGMDYKKPVKPGDTIRLNIVVTGKRLTHDAGRGIVFFDVNTVNQRDETVNAAKWKIMFKTRAYKEA